MKFLGYSSAVLILGLSVGLAWTATQDNQPAAKMLDTAAVAQVIDREIEKRLQAEQIKPSPQADDAEFLRRVYLDITGVIPTADKVKAFLDSKDPDKRAKLIDELLASPAYGRHQADTWQTLLIPRSFTTKRLQTEPLDRWLEEAFNENRPWNKLVTDLLTASGPQDKNGAVTFFIHNATPDKVTDEVCKLFLGVQLQCAQCHNHPFTGWKQTDYWSMAAFFMKVQLNTNPNKAAKSGVTPAVSETDNVRRNKNNQLPESAKIVPAKFLQGEEPKLSKSGPYRPVFAEWLTSAQNPFFARAMVNRTWAQFFGRGLVNPVDDMHDGNNPSHPELLQALAGQFAAHDFDVKELIREICNSKAYQRSSKPSAGNEGDTTLYSHLAVKSMSPEQLYDSLTAVLGNPGRQAERGRKAGGGKGMGNNPRSQFVNFFQTDDGADPTEYQAGIPQVLRLMNSPQLNTQAAAQRLASGLNQPAEAIEHLYLAALARRPTADEGRRLLEYVRKEAEPRKAYGDVLWALVNCSEFAFNH